MTRRPRGAPAPVRYPRWATAMRAPGQRALPCGNGVRAAQRATEARRCTACVGRALACSGTAETAGSEPHAGGRRLDGAKVGHSRRAGAIRNCHDVLTVRGARLEEVQELGAHHRAKIAEACDIRV